MYAFFTKSRLENSKTGQIAYASLSVRLSWKCIVFCLFVHLIILLSMVAKLTFMENSSVKLKLLFIFGDFYKFYVTCTHVRVT